MGDATKLSCCCVVVAPVCAVGDRISLFLSSNSYPIALLLQTLSIRGRQSSGHIEMSTDIVDTIAAIDERRQCEFCFAS